MSFHWPTKANDIQDCSVTLSRIYISCQASKIAAAGSESTESESPSCDRARNKWPQTNICKEQNTNTKNANITRIMKHQQITNEITQIIEVRMYKEKERRLSPCTQCRNLLPPPANKEKLNHAIFQPETP